MQTTGDCLLRAVLFDPEDDNCRLVYADWLEENGQPERAAYIRLAIEMAQVNDQIDELLKADINDWQKTALHKRHNRLGLKVRSLGRKAEIVSLPIGGMVSWRKGFVDSIWLTCQQFVENAEAIFSQHPVRRVRLTDKQPLPNRAFSSSPDAWLWHFVPAGRDDMPHAVPINLHPSLPDWQKQIPNIVFPVALTEEAKAKDFLSIACVIYGRTKANLTPTPPPKWLTSKHENDSRTTANLATE